LKTKTVSHIRPAVTSRIFYFIVFLLTIFFTHDLQAAAALSGIITDDSNKPLSDVLVELYPTAKNTQTDQNGAFFFPQTAAGSYEIRTTHIAYQSSRKEVEIKTGGSLKINIILKPATFIMKEINVSENYREAAKEIITRKEIENSSAAEAENLIKDLGGLQVFRTDGTGSKVSIRGSSSKHVKVMLDGVAFNSAMDGSFDLSAIPAEIIERVEVYKQGSAELSGQGIGGVINIVTRKDVVNANNELNAKWTGTGFYSDRDNWQTNRFSNSEISLDNSFSLYNHNILLSGSYKDLANQWSYINAAKYDAYRYINNPNTPYEMQNAYNRGNNFFSSVASNYRDFSYSYFFNYNENKNGLPGFIDKLYKSADMSDIARKHRLDLRFKFRENDYLSLNTYYDNGDKEIQINERPPFGVNSRDEYLNRGMNLKYMINTPWLIIRQGAAYNYEELTAKSLKGKVNNRETCSFYTILERNDSLNLGWSSAINTQTGVRHEILPGITGQNNFYSAQMNWEHKFMAFTVRPEAAYNESFNLPSFSDLFWMDNIFSAGNPNLKPEFAIARSAGIFVDWSNEIINISAGAECFNRDIKNLIVWIKDWTGKYSPKNNQGAYFSGWDYQAKVSAFDDLLTLKGDYHQLYSENYTGKAATDSNFVIYKPKDSFNTSLEIEWQGINAQFRANHNGRMYQNEVNSQDVDPFWLFGLSLSYTHKMFKQTEIKTFVEADNLLDKQYQMVYGYPMPGRSVKCGIKINCKY